VIAPPRPWAECRREWELSEYRLLLSPEQIAAAWAAGRCGQCGWQFDEHPVVVPVVTAEAVLLTPGPRRVDLAQAGTDHLMGRLTNRQYTALVAAADTALALLSPDSVLSGGSL
jgi:hypothetical protein